MANNIFSPRYDEVIDPKTGVVTLKPHIAPKSGPYDEFYYDYEYIEVPRPVEGSDDEYILVGKIKETKRSIYDVINSQADDVGLDNLMRKFELTGDPSVLPSPVKATDDILDLTQLPQDHAEYMEYIHNLYGMYQALPVELRKDFTMEEFVKNVSKEQVDNFLKSHVDNKKEGE